MKSTLFLLVPYIKAHINSMNVIHISYTLNYFLLNKFTLTYKEEIRIGPSVPDIFLSTTFSSTSEIGLLLFKIEKNI